MFDLSGKAAVITGGNGGIGLAFARGLARQGADLTIWGRNQDKNAAAEAELRAFGNKVAARTVDVVSEEAVTAAMAEANERHGRLDCVIVNAGQVVYANSLFDIDGATFRGIMDSNLNGAYYTMRSAAIHMIDQFKRGQGGGSIIVCGSLSVFTGYRGMEHYGAAKGGLHSIVKSMANELGRYQIRVNMIAPGFITTEGRNEEEADAKLARRHPVGRVGLPGDVEGAAVYLVSDASSFHTGDILTIDGGWMASLFR
jgi:NAD(P)-dependent dehydrogenase (short-subunit alcohol dehydrogenase family)